MKRTIGLLVSLMGVFSTLSCNVWANDYQMRVLEGVAVPGFAETINNTGIVFGNSSLPELATFLWSKDGNIDNLRNDNIYVGVNELGQTAGSYTNHDTMRTNPRIRNANGAITDYTIPDGAFSAWGVALNDKGQIGCTVEYRDAEDNVDHKEAAIYDPDGTITPVPFVNPLDINIASMDNTGHVVVRATTADDPKCDNYYVWMGNSDFVHLQSLEGAADVQAYDMNDTGQIVGTSGGHAVWWGLDGHIHDLGLGEAYGINSIGQIVGYSGANAVLWNTNGSFTDLPILGGVSGVAKGINDNGWIVGYISVPNVGAQAVLWQPVPEPSSILALLAGVVGMGALVRRRRI